MPRPGHPEPAVGPRRAPSRAATEPGGPERLYYGATRERLPRGAPRQPAAGEHRSRRGSMRTLIQGGWVVGFDGQGHELLRDGVVVYEEDRIIHVGYRFDGQADRTIDARGKLVSPGFINCHTHAGSNAAHIFLMDHTKADYFGSNFIAYGAGRRGAGNARSKERADVEQKYGLWSAIRGGATTMLDVGTRFPEPFLEMVGSLGARVYMGPGYRSSAYAFDDEGRVVWEPDEAAGLAGLERAVAFARQHDGAQDGRVRCMLFPGQ